MDNKSYTLRVPKRWVRISMIVGVTALIVAPLTAIATHRFNDVPNTHTFHDDIAWLKDADVTRGCNPPDNNLYCPNDNVTRGQMAAFIKRLAENRVVDAGTLEGKDSSEIESRAAAQLTGAAFQTVTEPTVINSVEVEAPTAGVLLISGSSYVFSTDSSAIVGLVARVNGDNVTPNGVVAVDRVDFNTQWDANTHLSYTVAMNVPAGTHTVDQLVSRVSGFTSLVAGNVSTRYRQLVVQFVPNGEVGIASLASTEPGDAPDLP